MYKSNIEKHSFEIYGHTIVAQSFEVRDEDKNVSFKTQAPVFCHKEQMYEVHQEANGNIYLKPFLLEVMNKTGKRKILMKELFITQNGNTFSAASSVTIDEMHGLKGSLFELWAASCDLLKTEESKDDVPEFLFHELHFRCQSFEATWNEDLVGYVITFSDGNQAQTQVNTESNRLHADYGEAYLERFTEYDDKLSELQEKELDDFIAEVNRLKHQF